MRLKPRAAQQTGLSRLVRYHSIPVLCSVLYISPVLTKYIKSHLILYVCTVFAVCVFSVLFCLEESLVFLHTDVYSSSKPTVHKYASLVICWMIVWLIRDCWIVFLTHIRTKKNEFIHLLSSDLLPPLHCQTLFTHSHTLTAYAHRRHGEKPQRQASEPGELLAHCRAPVLKEVRRTLDKRFGQVLKNLLSNLSRTFVVPRNQRGTSWGSAVVSSAFYTAYFRGGGPVSIPLFSTRTTSTTQISIPSFSSHFAGTGNDVLVLVGWNWTQLELWVQDHGYLVGSFNL